MTVEITRDGLRSTVVINRPDALNALNADVIGSLRTAISDQLVDDGVRVIVLSGAGDRAFCAGADLHELASMDHEAADRWLHAGHELMTLLWHANKPVIASVNGLALGGGCELALAATLAVACQEARFGLPEVRLGLVPGLGGTQRIIQSIGRHRGLRLLLTGDAVTADDAFSLGLLSMAPVPRSELAGTVDALVDRLLGAGREATASILELAVVACRDNEAGLVAERRTSAAAIAGAEGAKGIEAFLTRTARGSKP